MPQHAPYQVDTRSRNLILATVSFVGEAADPAVVNDPTGLLRAAIPVDHTGTGLYTLTLRDDYSLIYPFVSVTSTTTDESANVTAVVTTAGANSISLVAMTAGVADNLVGETVNVLFVLSLSSDA